MDRIGDLALKIAKSHDLKEEMDAAFVLEKMRGIIKIHWGEKGVQNLQPKKIVFNNVYLKASNSAWAQEIQLKKHEILLQLNQEKIKKILEIKITL